MATDLTMKPKLCSSTVKELRIELEIDLAKPAVGRLTRGNPEVQAQLAAECRDTSRLP